MACDRRDRRCRCRGRSEQDGAAFCDASAGKGKLVISSTPTAWAAATTSWATSS
ncbi:MAG: hypothetical protein ACLTYW_00985 [Collinsella sp.]